MLVAIIVGCLSATLLSHYLQSKGYGTLRNICVSFLGSTLIALLIGLVAGIAIDLLAIVLGVGLLVFVLVKKANTTPPENTRYRQRANYW